MPRLYFLSINLLAAINNKHLNSYLSHYIIEPAFLVNWFWLSAPLTMKILKENFTRLDKKKKGDTQREKTMSFDHFKALFLFQTVSGEHSCTCDTCASESDVKTRVL